LCLRTKIRVTKDIISIINNCTNPYAAEAGAKVVDAEVAAFELDELVVTVLDIVETVPFSLL